MQAEAVQVRTAFCMPYYLVQKRRTNKRASCVHWMLFSGLSSEAKYPATAGHSAGCPKALPSLFSEALIESRIGLTTNNANTTTMKFMTAATANTPCQLPVWAF